VGVSKSFRTGRLERELQMVQSSVTRCSCIAILQVNLVSFAAITLCVASQQVFIVISVNFVMTQSGNFWIHPHISIYIYIYIYVCVCVCVCVCERERDLRGVLHLRYTHLIYLFIYLSRTCLEYDYIM
jgi:hypothetical protein